MIETSVIERFLRDFPKVELHLHIEGTLKPDLMLEITSRKQRRDYTFQSR